MNKSTTEKGKWAEDIAEQFLKKKEYRILFRNWRAEKGDIDIIAMDGEYLVFVEVKSGSTELYGPPELRISPSKKRQLYKLALRFIQQSEQYHLDNEAYRFDVIIVDGYPNKYKIRHYEHAFYL